MARDTPRDARASCTCVPSALFSPCSTPSSAPICRLLPPCWRRARPECGAELRPAAGAARPPPLRSSGGGARRHVRRAPRHDHAPTGALFFPAARLAPPTQGRTCRGTRGAPPKRAAGGGGGAAAPRFQPGPPRSPAGAPPRGGGGPSAASAVTWLPPFRGNPPISFCCGAAAPRWVGVLKHEACGQPRWRPGDSWGRGGQTSEELHAAIEAFGVVSSAPRLRHLLRLCSSELGSPPDHISLVRRGLFLAFHPRTAWWALLAPCALARLFII